MFFHSPLLIALTLIGANIPDFDHKFKKDHVYKLIILGLIVFISLYILKLPYMIGLILIWSFQLVISITDLQNYYLLMAILIALLSFLFLNKNVLMIFLPLFFLSLFIFNTGDINYIELILATFLGLFSHIVLDSFTPAGIKIFAPLSSKKVHSNFGKVSIFVLIAMALFYHAPYLYGLFEQYVFTNV